LPPFLVDLAANLGTMAANFVKMAANQDLTYAAEGSLIRNMCGLSLAGGVFSPLEHVHKATRDVGMDTKE
jgi:hypothetical protein